VDKVFQRKSLRQISRRRNQSYGKCSPRHDGARTLGAEKGIVNGRLIRAAREEVIIEESRV
jgi:hypothetical protein